MTIGEQSRKTVEKWVKNRIQRHNKRMKESGNPFFYNSRFGPSPHSAAQCLYQEVMQGELPNYIVVIKSRDGSYCARPPILNQDLNSLYNNDKLGVAESYARVAEKARALAQNLSYERVAPYNTSVPMVVFSDSKEDPFIEWFNPQNIEEIN